jgi:hypothetical protein
MVPKLEVSVLSDDPVSGNAAASLLQLKMNELQELHLHWRRAFGGVSEELNEGR